MIVDDGISDPNEIGLFALLSAPLRPRSAQASPAYSRLPLVLVELVSMSSNQIKITIKKLSIKESFLMVIPTRFELVLPPWKGDVLGL